MNNVQRFVDAVRAAVVALPGFAGFTAWPDGTLVVGADCPRRGMCAVYVVRGATGGWVVRWDDAEMPIRTPRGAAAFDTANVRAIRDAIFARFPDAPVGGMDRAAYDSAWDRFGR